MLQIVDGLTELPPLVHRDLKPGNLLLHEGAWKIADFGIAKFVEESTSLNTLKGALSPPSAAPEQWRLQKAEVATDLYALGCIAYELISGTCRIQVLEWRTIKNSISTTPQLICLTVRPPKLKTLVSMLLRKSLAARPSLERVKQLLQGIQEEENNPRLPSPIAQAAARLEQQRAQEESASAQFRSKEASRESLAEAGRGILGELVSNLRKRIIEDAPTSEHDTSPEVRLGSAQISLYSNFGRLKTLPENMFPQSKLDVVLAKSVEIVQFNPKYVWNQLSFITGCRTLTTTDGTRFRSCPCQWAMHRVCLRLVFWRTSLVFHTATFTRIWRLRQACIVTRSHSVRGQ